MALSDDAAKAIAQAAAADPAWQGQRFTIDKALAAVLPDGRTIAQVLDEVERLRAVVEAADKVWRCERCNGGGLIAPGDCCQTCAGDGLRVEWADDGADLRPLVEALAELEAAP